MYFTLLKLLPKEHVADGLVHPTDRIVGIFMGEIRGVRARHVCVRARTIVEPIAGYKQLSHHL
jgi:hypothetical protein